MNYKVKDILQKFPYLSARETVSFNTLMRSEKEINYYVKRNLSQQLAHHFLESCPVTETDTPLGRQLQVTTYVLTREQMLNLCDEVFLEGQRSATNPCLSMPDPYGY